MLKDFHEWKWQDWRLWKIYRPVGWRRADFVDTFVVPHEEISEGRKHVLRKNSSMGLNVHHFWFQEMWVNCHDEGYTFMYMKVELRVENVRGTLCLITLVRCPMRTPKRKVNETGCHRHYDVVGSNFPLGSQIGHYSPTLVEQIERYSHRLTHYVSERFIASWRAASSSKRKFISCCACLWESMIACRDSGSWAQPSSRSDSLIASSISGSCCNCFRLFASTVSAKLSRVTA